MSDAGPVAVIGAGAWGTTLAWLLGGKGIPVRLWARRADQAAAICADRVNASRLPGTVLPGCVSATADLAEAAAGAQWVVTAVPSEHLREVAARLAPHLSADTLLVSATKGLELASGKRMTQVLQEETAAAPERVLALSGPNLSGEIVAGMPAVSVVAGTGAAAVEAAQRCFSSALFRVYGNCDILGVEFCGALKNVIALAAGVNDGLGFGANARAALVTRGLTEIARLGIRMGAQRATFWGTAGLGDVVATCSSKLSRNWQLGWRIGCGERPEGTSATHAGVAEGVPTTAAAHDLARRVGTEAPITSALYSILFQGREPADAVRELMARPWKSEAEDWQ